MREREGFPIKKVVECKRKELLGKDFLIEMDVASKRERERERASERERGRGREREGEREREREREREGGREREKRERERGREGERGIFVEANYELFFKNKEMKRFSKKVKWANERVVKD